MKTLSIGWVYVLRILREPASVFFFFIFPVVMVFIIGIQFGGGGGRVQLGVSGETSQSITDQITETLADNQALELVFYEEETEMLTAVERGFISAGVVFPPQLAARMAVGQPVRRVAIGRKADRAAVDALADDVGHLPALVVARLFFDGAFAHHVEAHGAVAHHAGDVDAGLEPLDGVEVAAVVLPVPG